MCFHCFVLGLKNECYIHIPIRKNTFLLLDRNITYTYKTGLSFLRIGKSKSDRDRGRGEERERELEQGQP